MTDRLSSRASRKNAHEISRRQFMRRAACAAVGTTALVNTVWDLRMINAASAATLPTDYKALVCLFLYGGNDGNNMLVPTSAADYTAYAAARGGVTLAQNSLLPISPLTNDGRSYGLHPACPELQSLFNGGQAAILCNVGTLVAPLTRAQYLGGTSAAPPNLFAHNDQSVQWQTSIADVPSPSGWGGRCADVLHTLNGASQVSMSISLAGTNTFEIGNVVNQYSVTPGGSIGLTDIPDSTLQAVKNMLAVPRTNLLDQGFTQVTTRAINNNALLTTALAGVPAIKTTFPNTSLGSQLSMIAKLISARAALGQNRQIFFASVNGYDLHNGEGAATGPHATLLAELSACMKAFYTATVELGVANNVTQFTGSDFGRSLGYNGSGTDHGWGNHQLIVGGAVQGRKLYGTFPNLALNGPDDTNQGRWIPTTSVDEYSATLARWFGVAPADLPTVFPNLGRFAHPNLGFMG